MLKGLVQGDLCGALGIKLEPQFFWSINSSCCAEDRLFRGQTGLPKVPFVLPRSS